MFNNFDTYDLETSMETAEMNSLKYDDSPKNRASIIMDAYEQQVMNIDPESLTQEDKLKYDNVVGFIQTIKAIKVVDASVFLKIFNLHRCSLV